MIKIDDNLRRKILDRCERLFQEAYQMTTNRRKQWVLYEKYFNNEMIKERPAYKSRFRKNYCWLIPQVKIPILVQNNPTVNYIPYDPSKDDVARTFSTFIGEYLWSKLKIQRQLFQAILSASIYDYGLIKVGFSKSADSIFVANRDIFKVFLDPLATSMDNVRYVIDVDVIPIELAVSKFPNVAKQIQPNEEYSKYINEDRKLTRYRTDKSKILSKRVSIKEYWVRDELMPELKGQGTGFIITIINDKIIARLEQSPYKHKRPPFVMFKLNERPNSLLGMGDIEQIIPMQDTLNHLYQLAEEITMRTANVGWTVDPSVSKKWIKGVIEALKIPGGVKVIPLNAIRMDALPQFPTYIFNLIQFVERSIEAISGITDVMQGRGDVRHRTASGLEILYETGTSRIALSRKLVDNSFKELAYLMGSVVQQFYTKRETFSIVGEDGSRVDIKDFKASDMQEKFMVTVDSGISLPQDKQSKADALMNLINNQIIQMGFSDDPVQKAMAYIVLKQLDIPFKDQILSGDLLLRMQEIVDKFKERQAQKELERKAKLQPKPQDMQTLNELGQVTGQPPEAIADQIINALQQGITPEQPQQVQSQGQPQLSPEQIQQVIGGQ